MELEELGLRMERCIRMEERQLEVLGLRILELEVEELWLLLEGRGGGRSSSYKVSYSLLKV